MRHGASWHELPTGTELREMIFERASGAYEHLEAIMERNELTWEELAFDLRTVMRGRRKRADRQGHALSECYFDIFLGAWIGGYINGLTWAVRRQERREDAG